MTDKEQIIIDGVDVSECIDFNKRDKISCYHLLYDKCNEVPNCYFKQLARKTQECKKLNNKIIDMNSIIEDAAINLGNKDFTLYDLPFEIKKLSQECDTLKSQLDFEVQQKEGFEQESEQLQEKYEALRLENQEGYEIVAELKQECEELKEKNQKLEMQLCNDCGERDDYNIPCKMIRDLDYGLQKEIEENDRYRKALEEIEGLVKNFCKDCDDYENCNWDKEGCYYSLIPNLKDIINEAKGGGNE